MSTYYTVIIFMSIFCMLSIQLCIFNSTTLNKRQKRFFYMFFSTIMISAFCEWFGLYIQGTGPSTRLLHIIIKCIELSLAPSISFWFSWVIERKYKKFVWIYLAVHAAIEMLSGIFGFVYYVDENSNYMHGEFYWIYVAAYIIPIAYCIYVTLINIKKYQYNGISYYISIIVFMLTGIVFQLCDSNIKVVYLTATIASVMMYIFTLEMIHRTDELTGLINRRGYENIIANIENKCTVIFFDIDNFKGVNDNFGHTEGDVVLRKVGRLLREKYAKHGNCFRFGGDEFCVVIKKNTEHVEALNEEFLKAIQHQMKHNGKFPNVSLGYAHYDPETGDIREAMAEADKMMYRHKAAHKRTNDSQVNR